MNADRGVQMEKSNGSHQAETHRPTHGFTRAGHPVHGKVIDHLPSGTGYERFNKKVAIWLVKNVGTMTCFWVFLFIAFLSLPATLVLATVFKAPTHTVVITFALSYGFIFLIDWLCQNVIQLIRRIQPVSARNSVSFSDGFIYPSVFRGRLLRLAAKRSRSAALCTERSVPFGMY